MEFTSNGVLLELAINFSDVKDLTKVSEILRNEGLELVSSSLADKTVQIRIGARDSSEIVCDTKPTAPYPVDVRSLQRSIEEQTGLLVVVKGLGYSQAAVAELLPSPCNNSKVFGVVRLSQLDNGVCYADGSIEGYIKLPNEGPHMIEYQFALSIHEFGDLSGDNFDSIGNVVVELAQGLFQLSEDKRLDITFRRFIPNCKLAEMIGRSVALVVKDVEGVADGTVVSAAVLARASEISKNDKKICACSGKTIWEERHENS